MLVPLREELLRERVRHEILGAYLADNRKARILTRDGTYMRPWQLVHGKRRKPPAGAAAFNAQEFLIDGAGVLRDLVERRVRGRVEDPEHDALVLGGREFLGREREHGEGHQGQPRHQGQPHRRSPCEAQGEPEHHAERHEVEQPYIEPTENCSEGE